MKKIMILVSLVTLSILAASAQCIRVFGEGDGSTRDIAIRNALKSALEQAYGTFISSNTEILNDEIISDDIVSLQYGNVQSYKILSESGEAEKYVFIEAIIDSDKLAKYAQSKGAEAELAGNTFAMNVRLATFNAGNMEKTLIYLIRYLADLSKQIYDYQLEVAEPVLDAQEVYVPIAVKCHLNKNAYSFFKTSKEVYQAIYRAYNSNQIRGNLPEQSVNRIAAYLAFIPHIQRLACYNFRISDNVGNVVSPQFSDTTIVGSRPSDIIPFDFGYLKASGIKIDPLNEAELKYSVLHDYIHSIKLRWNYNPYNYYFYMIDNLNEVAYSSTRQMRDNTAWFSERLELYPQQMKVGALNGTVRMVLVYDIDQISKVKKIEVCNHFGELI